MFEGMENKTEIEIIEIKWDGPLTLNEILEGDKGKKSGLYQIYGTHNIFGANTLLYIGKADESRFIDRISKHQKDWICDESSEVQIFLGTFHKEIDLNDNEWSKQVDKAERLLINYCSPPYNSSNIIKHGIGERTVVLNFEKKCRLPYEVSNLMELSGYNKDKFD
jgi:hypothetical protein